MADVSFTVDPWAGPPLSVVVRLADALGDRDADEERHECGDQHAG